jgi:hypothetical protein
MRRLALLLCISSAFAADHGPALLSAAKKGSTEALQTALSRGAAIESRDKQGRTALILAAQNGHADAVMLLIQKGADTRARDKEGWTAWGRAYASGEAARDRVLDMLPPIPVGRVTLNVKWTRDNLYSSCSLSPAQLAEHVAGLQPDEVVIAALGEAAAQSKRRMLEFTPEPGGDAELTIRVRPGASCLAQQTADQLSMAVDAKLEWNHAALLVKTFGGGLKGLHVRAVRSPAQYQPLYSEWAKIHAGQIYDAAVESWLRAEHAPPERPAR